MRALIDNLIWFGRIASQRFSQSVPTVVSRNGRTQRDINRPQHYGVATVPPDGSTIVGVAPHGLRLGIRLAFLPTTKTPRLLIYYLVMSLYSPPIVDIRYA